MTNLCRSLALGLIALEGVLGSSCASAGRLTTVPFADPPVALPTQLAQSAVNACRPGDPSLVCCIKKFPSTAMESCGATLEEVAEVLSGVRVLNEAAEATEHADAAEDAAQGKEDDFANNAHLPAWKQRCIKNYYACQQEPDWTGPCYDCLRRCEGQREWPIAMCSPAKSRKKR